MIKIIKKKINMSDELKTKIDWSCKFSKQKYKIYEGCLRIVEHTNLVYVDPHKVIINNQLYLFFNEQKYFYLGNLQNKIPLSELSKYIECKCQYKRIFVFMFKR